MVFLAARAAGVRGMAAYAFANGAALRTRALELEFEPAVIAAAEPTRPSTAASAAAKNQTRLCIRYTLRSVRTGSLDGGANSLRHSPRERPSRALDDGPAA